MKQISSTIKAAYVDGRKLFLYIYIYIYIRKMFFFFLRNIYKKNVKITNYFTIFFLQTDDLVSDYWSAKE